MDETTRNKVLVVDDAPQNVKLLRLILKDAGYEVSEANSGREALEKLQSERPAAMVLDVRMPGMTGYEVCRAVRADPAFATLPVIMVTALSMPEERIKGIESGATDFITKPFNKKELIARLQSSLSLARAEVHGVLEHLTGSVVILDAQRRLVAVSQSAAELLGLGAVAVGAQFGDLLRERGVELPGEAESRPWEFSFDYGGHRFQARETPVSDCGRRMVLRVITICTDYSQVDQAG